MIKYLSTRQALLVTLLLYSSVSSTAQVKKTYPVSQPAKKSDLKLVVGIVVDQMRGDYVERFWNKYSDGGFKRLVNGGFFFKDANYNYVPTYTAPGHACIYTGTTPSVNGIVSNDWYDTRSKKWTYCAGDSTVNSVGTSSASGKMSPVNLQSTTITDELRAATNFKAKVISISLKDRGAILPAGHHPTSAYWHDPSTNHWITSTYYMNELPKWVNDFNSKNLADSLLSNSWTTLLPIDGYTESTADDVPYEGLFKGETKPIFPHYLPWIKNQEKELIRKTPFGNTFTKELAQAAVAGEKLGQRDQTDFLCISFSSTDYVGHQFGTNAIETEDTYLRLDKDLADLFGYLDKAVGKNNYLLFLTSDHGAAINPTFNAEHHLPGGLFNNDSVHLLLKSFLDKEYGTGDYVTDFSAHAIYLNRSFISEKKISLKEIRDKCAEFLRPFDEVAMVVTSDELVDGNCKNGIAKFIQNGYYESRSADIMVELKPGWIEWSRPTGTTHGSAYSYDTHVPLIFYGWKIPHGESSREVVIPDVAPTLSLLLGIPFPSGTTGKPLVEIIK